MTSTPNPTWRNIPMSIGEHFLCGQWWWLGSRVSVRLSNRQFFYEKFSTELYIVGFWRFFCARGARLAAVAKTSKRLYLIPVLFKALGILELLQAEGQPMTLEQIHRRTKISKTTVYRVLKTFVHRGYLAQSQDGTYRQVTRPRKLRFGFGGQSADMPFSNEVTRSLEQAAASFGVDLMVLDN